MTIYKKIHKIMRNTVKKFIGKNDKSQAQTYGGGRDGLVERKIHEKIVVEDGRQLLNEQEDKRQIL